MTTDFGKIKRFIDNSYVRTGFFKPSDFEVEFIDRSVVNTFGLTANIFTILSENIKSIEVPSFALEMDVTPYRHRFGRRTPGDITMAFYDSSNLEIRRNFFKWINGMIQENSDTNNYLRKYFDDCIVDIRVKHILPGGNLSSESMWDYFYDVYPISTSAVSYDTSNENELGTTTIQWKYRYHTVGNLNTKQVTDRGV